MGDVSFQQAIIDAIDTRIKIFMSNLKYDKTLYGKVISYANGTAVVEIDEISYNCSCVAEVLAGAVVRVIAPNNNYKKLYVDIVSSGGGGTGSVTSVSGRTGDVVLSKSDVGLGNVNNTSDLSKPISTATQTALDGKSSTTHTHTELHAHANKTILDSITQSLLDNWNAAYTHVSDTIKHISSDERTLWNTVSNKVDSSRVLTDVPSGAVFTDTTYSTATDTTDGLMSSANKIKLDGIEEQANKTVILDSVTSTSFDTAASSNSVKIAYDKGNHTHPYAPLVHTHTKSQITDLPTIPTDTNELIKSDVYTKTEVDSLVSGGVAVVEASGYYYFDVKTDGNLYVRYADDGVAPNLAINTSGELILTI